jgi:tripartite-type tricarboxylate transporter receptor subunit TctC
MNKKEDHLKIISRRSLGLGLVATPILSGIAGAQSAYPTRTVSIVNPFAAGGQSDAVARFVARQLQKALGHPFVVDNRSGAGSTIGTAFVAAAAPDGNTLVFGTTSTYVIAPYTYRTPGYDPVSSFSHITVAAEGPMVLCCSGKAGFKSASELVSAAKRAPNRVTYASAGNGTFPHLLGEMFARTAGIEMTHVPYRGGGPAMNDLVGGQVDLFFEAIVNVTGHAKEGLIVPLMTTGGERSTLLPDVPTAAELNYPTLNLLAWTGFSAPARTQPAVIATLNREITKALHDPEATELFVRLGITAVGGSPEDMSQRIARESAIYRNLIREAGLTSD